MSAVNHAGGGPISPGSALGRALADDPVPPLAPDFAERVLAAASARAPMPAPALPPLRRARPARGWRTARRLALGGAAFAALACAAAATGLLERFDLPVPSPAQVWATLTRSEPPAARPAHAPAPPVPQTGSAAEERADGTVRAGPIDTPAELEEAFQQIDRAREERSARRRALMEQRIATELERRRAAGLPVPTPENEARLRERLDAARARREAISRQRIDLRRAELRERIENGEPLTREDLRPPRSEAAPASERGRLREEWLGLSPEERRARLRGLPLSERRALLRELMRNRVPQRQATPDTPAAPEAKTVASPPAAQQVPHTPDG